MHDLTIRLTWTQERTARLTELWCAGLTVINIGLALNVSPSAIMGKAHRLHLQSRPSPIKRKEAPRRSQLERQREDEAKIEATIEAARFDVRHAVEPIEPPKPVCVAPTRLPTWMTMPVGRARTCQFPLWPHKQPVPRPAKFCDKPSTRGSWCAVHARLVHIPAGGRYD